MATNQVDGITPVDEENRMGNVEQSTTLESYSDEKKSMGANVTVFDASAVDEEVAERQAKQ